MAQVSVQTAALYARADGEWRIHEHDRGREPGQAVGDGLRVVPVHGDVGKEPCQESRPSRSQFVEVKVDLGRLAQCAVRHDREEPGAGGRLQHPVAWADRGRLRRHVGQRQGRGELLQANLLLRAAGVGRFERRQALEHVEHGGGASRSGAGLAPHGHAVASDEQHHGRLGGVVGVLPHPGAFGVAASERGGHGIAQDVRGEAAAPGQADQEVVRGHQQTGRLVPGGGCPGRGGIRARGHALRRRIEHGRTPSDGQGDKGPAR